ncbi:MAG: nitrate reductase molybdenum cofactor assembly chaperone [Gammaproteobacteria bacterium]|nr:MAG: nitrate reductase molybdenum cofactor assembly chaperone [Gammaproteobacteria bacterium]
MNEHQTPTPQLSTLLSVIARLLDYPTNEIWAHSQALCEAVGKSPYIPPDLRRNIIGEINTMTADDIYERQARYDGLFDRGRSVSLSLFEHVHGESRERGQAMVDLLEVYRQHGLEINSEQMPDYIPLFLEFLSTQDDNTARQWLADVGHILTLLTERLRKRDAWEARLFEALLTVAGQPLHDQAVNLQVADEADDSTLSAIDKAWEDREIRFDEPLEDGSTCSAIEQFQQINGEQPIIWDKKGPGKPITNEVSQ